MGKYLIKKFNMPGLKGAEKRSLTVRSDKLRQYITA